MNKPDYPHPDMGCPDLFAPHDAPRARLGTFRRFERWLLRHRTTLTVCLAVAAAYWLARN